jgi:short-subunit dehydrogenase
MARVAIVTGGTRGIGEAISTALKDQGFTVVANYAGNEEKARAFTEATGIKAYKWDVGDHQACLDGCQRVSEEVGPIDIVVNNAGIMPIGPFEEESDATAIRQLELNLHAVIHGSKEAVRRMKPRRTGHIVNVASIAGKFGAPGGATYSACKHGVVGLSESLRAELYGTGVEVHVVMPAFVKTELIAGTNELKGVKRSEPEDVAEGVIQALQSGRFEVYVPKNLVGLVRSSALTPRSFSEWLGRKMGGSALLGADKSARAAYEARAAQSTPAAEAVVAEAAADEPKTPAAA